MLGEDMGRSWKFSLFPLIIFQIGNYGNNFIIMSGSVKGMKNYFKVEMPLGGLLFSLS